MTKLKTDYSSTENILVSSFQISSPLWRKRWWTWQQCVWKSLRLLGRNLVRNRTKERSAHLTKASNRLPRKAGHCSSPTTNRTKTTAATRQTTYFGSRHLILLGEKKWHYVLGIACFLIYGPPDHLLLLFIYDIKLQIEIIIWVSSEVPAI